MKIAENPKILIFAIQMNESRRFGDKNKLNDRKQRGRGIKSLVDAINKQNRGFFNCLLSFINISRLFIEPSKTIIIMVIIIIIPARCQWLAVVLFYGEFRVPHYSVEWVYPHRSIHIFHNNHRRYFSLCFFPHFILRFVIAHSQHNSPIQMAMSRRQKEMERDKT